MEHKLAREVTASKKSQQIVLQGRRNSCTFPLLENTSPGAGSVLEHSRHQL